jgi:dihydrolipoamide dehydrogenase
MSLDSGFVIALTIGSREMAETSYDCVVIGSGPGGYVAAIRAAQLGKKTAVVEKDKVGGRCLNYACIPAKAVLRSADLLSEIRDSEEFGLRVSGVAVDYPAVQARREKVVATLTGGVAGLFKKNGVDLIEGEASLGARGESSGAAIPVRVGERELDATTVILAAGSVPRAIPGVELGGRVLGTEEAWALAELPGSLAVVGAGASGAEIASGFARLGSEVLLLEALDRVLGSEDADISRLVERGLKRQSIGVHTGTPIESVQASDAGVKFSYGSASAEVDYLVIATGRGPDVQALGLNVAGVELDERGLVEVNGAMRTSAAGVYAIGDLVAGPALAHKASDEGVIAVEDSAGLETHPLAYIDIPRATFCTPNVGSFGLTEAQAREQGHDVVVGKVPYGAVGGGTVYGDRTGLVKLVGESKYGELLGGHIVGARATELIQELVNVRALEGGYAEVARTIHGHPTLSEAVMEAGRAADGWLIHG